MKDWRRNTLIRFRWSLLSLTLALAVTCCLLNPAPHWAQRDPAGPRPGVANRFPNAPDPKPAADQSFHIPAAWARELTAEQGWGTEHPRMLADINGDGKQDVVGFGYDGVWAASSNGYSFSPSFVLADFGYLSGWRAAKHVRLTGDLNGDKLDDLVGFGDAGVYRSLASPAGFGPVNYLIADFGYDQGWRVEKHVRLLADVSGDGRKDIVAFGNCRLHNESTVARLAARECYLETPLIVVTTGRERKNKRGR
jgi:hypothetical protein